MPRLIEPAPENGRARQRRGTVAGDKGGARVDEGAQALRRVGGGHGAMVADDHRPAAASTSAGGGRHETVEAPGPTEPPPHTPGPCGYSATI